MALPTYFGSASNPADNGSANEPGTLAVTPPASMLAGDLVVIIGQMTSVVGQITVGTTGGQTWSAIEESEGGGVAVAVFWTTFNGTWSANPGLAFAARSGTRPATVVMHVFRPDNTSATWAVDQAFNAAAFAAAATTTIPGITTAQPNVVTLAGWLSIDDNTWSLNLPTDLSFTGGTGTSFVQGGTGASSESNQALGQSFTPTTNQLLGAINLRILRTSGVPTDSVFVEVATSISGAAIATSDEIAGSDLTTATTLRKFIFSSPPSLSSGTKYYFRVVRSGPRDTTNYYQVLANSGNPYASHGSYLRQNNAWSVESPTIDRDFETETTSAEPWTTTGLDQYRNLAGADQSATFAHKIQAVAAATGDASKTQTALGNDAGVRFIISFFASGVGGSTTNQTVAATATTAVAIAKSAGKRVAATASGAVSALKAGAKRVAITAIGAPLIARASAKLIAASGTTGVTAIASRALLRTLSVAASSAVATRKAAARGVAVAGTGAVGLVKSAAKRISVSASAVVIATKSAAKLVLTTVASVAVVVKSTAKRVLAAVAGVASMAKVTAKIVSAAIGALVSVLTDLANTVFYQTVAAGGAVVATIAKTAGKRIATATTASVTLSKLAIKSFVATSASAVLVDAKRAFLVLVSIGLSGAIALRKQAGRAVNATAGGLVSVVRPAAYLRAVSATSVAAASLVKRASRLLLVGAQSLTAVARARSVLVAVSASVASVATLVRGIGLSVGAAAFTVVATGKAISLSIAAFVVGTANAAKTFFQDVGAACTSAVTTAADWLSGVFVARLRAIVIATVSNVSRRTARLTLSRQSAQARHAVQTTAKVRNTSVTTGKVNNVFGYVMRLSI